MDSNFSIDFYCLLVMFMQNTLPKCYHSRKKLRIFDSNLTKIAAIESGGSYQ